MQGSQNWCGDRAYIYLYACTISFENPNNYYIKLGKSPICCICPSGVKASHLGGGFDARAGRDRRVHGVDLTHIWIGFVALISRKRPDIT